MSRKGIKIAILEPSHLIYNGLASVMAEPGREFSLSRVEDLPSLQQQVAFHLPDIVILNPSLIIREMRIHQLLRSEYPSLKWIGLLYAYYDQQILSMFDGLISINDQPHTILSLLRNIGQRPSQEVQESADGILSERETEVLHLLVTGNAIKEIADKLNISAHTVITHRKNISAKTGIKSVSGLTLYAVVKGIIAVDQFR